MEITSTAFTHGATIPVVHTCDGKDVSPPLRWSGAPAATKSYVLIADDPDAPVGTWVHWLVYDLSPGSAGLAENVSKALSLPDGAKQGINSFRRPGYGGPCPPHGKAHRYFFRLYALDGLLGLKPGADRAELEAAMRGRVLASAEVMGTYARK